MDINKWGYGNKSFWWEFNLFIKEAPKNFKFLEIGVFKGSIISLISILNKIHQKEGQIYGITPLTNDGDKYSKHPDVDYELCIQQIYTQFGLDASDLSIIQGFSNDNDIIKLARNNGPYDIIYVDGCHDYEVVVSDLENYKSMIVLGGYMIIDDASNDLQIPNGLIYMDWRGLPDVTNAS